MGKNGTNERGEIRKRVIQGGNYEQSIMVYM